MSKKRDNDPTDRMAAMYEAAFNDVSEQSRTDVHRALAEAGVDVEALRSRLHGRANELAKALRAGGTGAPPALKRLLEQTAGSQELPENPLRAFEKASQILGNMFVPRLGLASTEIVGAFRGEGDLTNRDEETIDAIDEELRRRAEETDGDETP